LADQAAHRAGKRQKKRCDTFEPVVI